MGALSGDPGSILEWDVESRRQTIVPDSHGLFSPRPSPDGRYLAALDRATFELAIRDQRRAPGHAALRVRRIPRVVAGRLLAARPRGRRLQPHRSRERAREHVAGFAGAVLVGGEWGAWSGLGPDDTPLALVSKEHFGG